MTVSVLHYVPPFFGSRVICGLYEEVVKFLVEASLKGPVLVLDPEFPRIRKHSNLIVIRNIFVINRKLSSFLWNRSEERELKGTTVFCRSDLPRIRFHDVPMPKFKRFKFMHYVPFEKVLFGLENKVLTIASKDTSFTQFYK